MCVLDLRGSYPMNDRYGEERYDENSLRFSIPGRFQRLLCWRSQSKFQKKIEALNWWTVCLNQGDQGAVTSS